MHIATDSYLFRGIRKMIKRTEAMKNEYKFKDSDRVTVNYEKIINRANKIGLSLSTVSRAIGRSPGYISAMCSGASKMLYCDLKQIARVLNVHGATKLIAEENQSVSIDEDALKEINADTPTRIAIALESIASSLRILVNRK